MSGKIVAIDGPAASGKGTLARRVADALGYAWLDTGLLYRAVGLALLRAGQDPANADAAVRMADTLRMTLDPAALADPALRDDAAAGAASQVSAIPPVRTALLALQRGFAERPPGGAKGAVLDGRDIGTVVCPDAPAKLFLVADVAVRAERRLKELRERGVAAIFATVLEDLTIRDKRDSQRTVAPLVPAADAFVLDVTALDPDQAFAAAMRAIAPRLG